jgi:catechol 2,3-dioxygenase-like lactoylglutathione lyase family enzyme
MANLSFISPFFIVSNLKNSVAFYVDKLGFEVWYTGPDTGPFFAMVGRGPVSIMLKVINNDIQSIPNPTRHEWAAWDAYVAVEDPDKLFEEFCSTGVVFRKPIHDNGDGLRGFEVADADGYVLFFGQPKAK